MWILQLCIQLVKHVEN